MPSVIRIDAHTALEMTEGNAPAIQAAIARAITDATTKADGKVAELLARAEKAEKRAAIVLDNAKGLVAKQKRIKVIWDAVKAKMIGCDECAGTGKIGDGDKAAQCDFCDGTGAIRMHSPIMAAKDEDAPDDDDMDMEMEESMDEDELEVEQKTEEEAGSAHTDAASKKRLDSRRRQRKEDAKAFAAERAASVERMVRRRLDARRALEDGARKYVPEGTDLTKLDDKGIRLAVIKALAPTAKMDGKTDADVNARYVAEIERATEQGTGTDGVVGVGPRADEAHHVATGTGQRQKFDANWIPDPEAARAKYHETVGKPGAAK